MTFIKKTVLVLVMGLLTTSIFAQQWLGDSGSNAAIYRMGPIGIGVEIPIMFENNEAMLKLGANGTARNALTFENSLVGATFNFRIDGGINGEPDCLTIEEKGTVKPIPIASFLKTGDFRVEGNLYVPNFWSKVGIGTSTPSAKLHVYGVAPTGIDLIASLKLGGNVGTEIQAIQEGGVDVEGLAFRVSNDISQPPRSFEAMRIKNNGNVGIGTSNPMTKLHIYGENAGDGGVLASIKLGELRSPEIQAIQLHENGSGIAGLAFRVSNGSPVPLNFEAMRIDSGGRVGIGTSTPDEKLAVNGKIHSQEVRVDLNDWPDFVFEKEYPLPSLAEVETQINTKGHLKDIPSATEVNENGIHLGEMNAKLLQKVEELMLYTIQQDKEIKELKNLATMLKERLEALESKD